MEQNRAREELARFGASLFERGFSTGSGGNLSVKLSDGTIIATPTGSSLGRLDPAKLSHVSLSGELLEGDAPSKECAFHLEIYKARPECGAVVHLHSTYATALSCCKGLDPADVIQPFTPYYVMQIAPLPLVPYFRPGSLELFAAIARAAMHSKCLLLANHGLITTGKTLEKAVNCAEELEETAKLLFILKSAGVDINYLTPAQVEELS